jgi:hypothetical protein
MIIFGADKPYIGGYGDRIVGLVSCKVIADALGHNFRILWTTESIRPFFNYDQYEYRSDPSNSEPVRLHLIDKQTHLKETLLTCPTPFDKPAYILNINTDISQYLYKNPLFSHKSYFSDVFATYRQLYTHILLPTEPFLEKVKTIVLESKEPVIGIQIRTGDIYIPNIAHNSYRVIDSPQIILPPLLQGIKSHIEQTMTEYRVFLTSDYGDIYTLAAQVWSPDQLIYDAQPIQHLDRRPSGDISKIFTDNYILSQKTHTLYISEWSNFGRVAALSSSHGRCFNLECKSLTMKSLLSKHEQFSE